ncbi:hypothetical protein ACNKHW_03820 [Shigella flexneri]
MAVEHGNNLPDGVTVTENVIKETSIEGGWATHWLPVPGEDVNVIIRNASGQFPPLGAGIRQDDSGISVGMVGEEGHAWLPTESLKIKSLPSYG